MIQSNCSAINYEEAIQCIALMIKYSLFNIHFEQTAIRHFQYNSAAFQTSIVKAYFVFIRLSKVSSFSNHLKLLKILNFQLNT